MYDNLISDEILKLIPTSAEKIFAGKTKSQHLLKQYEINALLVELSKKYKSVVRLKGGDPFIFGRGGEEVAELRKARVAFEIVPGITSAQGCSAAIGIPLTHRDYVSGVHFFTGHGCRDIEPDVDWQILANEDKTLVIYMGLTNIKTIAKKLVEYGMAANTPAVVVENGTTKDQREFYGTLSELPVLLEKNAVKSPALIIIGRVVALSSPECAAF